MIKYKEKIRYGELNEFFGRMEFIHKSSNERSSSFERGEDILLNVYIPYNVGADNLSIKLFDEEIGKAYFFEAVLYGLEVGYEIYKVKISADTLGAGLYFGSACVTVQGEKYESSGCYESLAFSKCKKTAKNFQITVTDFKYVLPKLKNRGIIYHIFVDRFARSLKTEQFVDENIDWEYIPEYPEYPGAPIKNKTFFGGSLYGIIEKLDHIKSLGASLIYLSPIFLSPSNHRYDTSDYMTVDPRVGGESALRELILEAKKRGIGIILDGVFNHTGSDSIYFNKENSFDSIGAYQSRDSEYFEWYNFSDHPHKYECWWGIEILPRIKPDIPSCRRYFTGKGGVIEKYSELGVMGFRLDVADELSDEFISAIKHRLSKHGNKLLYGEVWEDASNKIAYGKRKRYYLGDELDGVMNYPLREGLIEFVKSKNSAKLRYALEEVYLNAPSRISNMQMNLLGSHDTARILTVLGTESLSGQNSELRKRKLTPQMLGIATERLKSLYTVLISLPGIPMVYYGDEAGMEGYSDPFNRMPYPWGYENDILLSHYQKLGRIRSSCNAFSMGEFHLIQLDDGILVFSRILGEEKYITVYNNFDFNVFLLSGEPILALIADKWDTQYVIEPERAEIFKIKDIKQIRIKREVQW